MPIRSFSSAWRSSFPWGFPVEWSENAGRVEESKGIRPRSFVCLDYSQDRPRCVLRHFPRPAASRVGSTPSSVAFFRMYRIASRASSTQSFAFVPCREETGNLRQRQSCLSRRDVSSGAQIDLGSLLSQPPPKKKNDRRALFARFQVVGGKSPELELRITRLLVDVLRSTFDFGRVVGLLLRWQSGGDKNKADQSGTKISCLKIAL